MEKVSFYSQGIKLIGYVHTPKVGNKKTPGIVCCHGYSGMIENYMQDIAESITGAGYTTLAFYHRGLGESEGTKGRVIPQEQAEDVRNAISYLQTRPEVDPDKIGLYGTSLGGANVLYAAAIDKRAKCVISVGGIGDCERWLKCLRRRWEWIEFLKKLKKDEINRVLTGKSQYVDPDEIVPHDPGSLKVVGEKFKGFDQKWGIKGYTLETASAMLEYKPELVVDQISPRPILFMHMGDDVLVPAEESYSMYQKAGEPKKIIVFDCYMHQDVYKYKNPAAFKRIMATAIDWYREHLPSD